jgi:hypothetical protein
VSTLPAILPPRVIVIRHLHVILRLLPIVISEVHIVREPASALVASHAIHEVDAILRVAHDAFLGVAAHHERLVEVRQNAVPACGGAVECKLRWVWVLPFCSVSVCTGWDIWIEQSWGEGSKAYMMEVLSQFEFRVFACAAFAKTLPSTLAWSQPLVRR